MLAGEVPVPQELIGEKEQIIFGNIESILEWHKECVNIIYIFFFSL